ncbi:MAG: hypothetical protein ACRD82_09160, partial [Blastocatellia bacterium]
MCQIFVCKKGAPNHEQLKDASSLNSDGAGVAWEDKKQNKILWKKCLDLDDVKKVIKKLEYPYIIHFRSASTGGKSELLTQPFPLDQDALAEEEGETKVGVLFHNGTWHSWEDKLLHHFLSGTKEIPPGPWNDSRAIAYLVGMYGPAILRFISWGGGRLTTFRPGENILLYGDWTPATGEDWWHSA